MIRLKSNLVKIDKLNKNLLQFLTDMSIKFDGIVVTSGNDSTHMVNSRHYINKAIDIGANSSNKIAYANFKNFVKANKTVLKVKYSIEDILDEINHIHIEMPASDIEIKAIKKKV